MLWGEGRPMDELSPRKGSSFASITLPSQEQYLQAGHCPHDEVPDSGELFNEEIGYWGLG